MQLHELSHIKQISHCANCNRSSCSPGSEQIQRFSSSQSVYVQLLGRDKINLIKRLIRPFINNCKKDNEKKM